MRKVLEVFKDKYYGASAIFNRNIFFKFAELLVRKGILDLELFENEIMAIISKSVSSTPLYLRFIRDGYWDLSDEEFFEAEKEAYEKLMNGDVHFAMYFRAYTLYQYLIEKGFIIKVLEPLKKELMSGLQLSAEKSEYYPNMDTFFIGTQIPPEDRDLIDLKETIISINRELKEKRDKAEVQLLMDSMTSDFGQFLMDMRDKYFYVPVFSHYDVDELMKKILELSNSQTSSFIQLIEKRYHLSGTDLKLYQDLENLLLLKDKIDEYVMEKRMTPKLSLLKELSETIAKVAPDLAKQVPIEESNHTEVDDDGGNNKP